MSANNIIPIGRVNQRKINNIATILETGTRGEHHGIIEAQLPIMLNQDHMDWCVGGICGFVKVAIDSLREIAKDPGQLKTGSAQYKMFDTFLKSVKKRRDRITLLIWFANGNSWQIKFTVTSDGHYVPVNAWVNDYNVFEKIITDCAEYFDTTREEVLRTWFDELEVSNE